MADDAQMEFLIEKAKESIAKKGLEASDREILLAGLSWVVKELKPYSTNNGRSKFNGIIVKLTPGAVGGILAGLLLGLFEVLKGII